MSDPNLYRFVEQSVIEALRADIEKLRSETSYQKARLDTYDQKFWEYENYLHRHEKYPYRVSVIIVTPEAASQKVVPVDEIIYVATTAEAETRQKEIMERQHELKRKVMVASQSSIRPVPF